MDNRTTARRTVGRPLAVALAALALLLAACDDPAEIDVANPYPQLVQDNFTNACLENSGGMESYCACLLAKTQNRFTLAQFQDIERRLTAGEPVEDLTAFLAREAQRCIPGLGG